MPSRSASATRSCVGQAQVDRRAELGNGRAKLGNGHGLTHGTAGLPLPAGEWVGVKGETTSRWFGAGRNRGSPVDYLFARNCRAETSSGRSALLPAASATSFS